MSETLEKRLSVIEAVGLGVGAMIGGTIYAGTGIAMTLSGGAADIAYLLAAALAFLVANSYIVLCKDLADSGGSYSLVSKVLGEKAGTLASILQLTAYTIASAFYAVMASEYLFVSLGAPKDCACLALIAIVTALNILGAKESGMLEALISGIKVSILLVVALYAAVVLKPPLTPPRELVGLVKASSILFLGFEGFEVIASASGEMVNPQRDVKVAMVASLGIVGATYMLLAYASRSLTSYHEAAILTSLSSVLLGDAGLYVITAGAILSAFTALNANVYTVSRLLYALGRDGHAPRSLAHTWRGRSPIASVVLAGCMAAALAISGKLKLLLALSSLSFMAIFALVSLAAFKARRGLAPIASLAGLTLFSAVLAPEILH